MEDSQFQIELNNISLTSRRKNSIEDNSKRPNSIELKDLFFYSRFQKSYSWKQFILLVLWFPFGVILATLRIIIWIFILIPIFGFLSRFNLQENFLSFSLFLLGVIRVSKNKNYFTAEPPPTVIAMNHRTDWDIIGVFHKPFVVIVSPYWKKFQSLVTFLGAKVNMIYARQQAGDTFVSSSMRDSVIHAIQQHFLQTASHPIPLVIFPEGGTTNGRGILQFNKTILGIAPEVLPLAIDIRFPFPLPIHVDYLFDSWITNVWWSFFFPLIVYEFTFLPRQKKQYNESDVEFANRVQKCIANSLGIPATNYTYKDKNNLRKGWNPIL